MLEMRKENLLSLFLTTNNLNKTLIGLSHS